MPKQNRGRHSFSAGSDAPIPGGIYPVIDTDLARDNLENDLPEADRQDLLQQPGVVDHQLKLETQGLSRPSAENHTL